MTFNFNLGKKVKPMKDLPNLSGFSFNGVTKDDEIVRCFVNTNDNGMHQIVDMNLVPYYSKLSSWF